MEYNLAQAGEILERTPVVLENLLSHLSVEWIVGNEGENTWSPFDVLGHLCHGERVDWPQRIQKIMDPSLDPHFEPFNREAQFKESEGKSLQDLLDEFALLREKNLEMIDAMNIKDEDLEKTGFHPAFGEVTLRNLLSTWVAHDLGHIAQIVRVMAKQYSSEVGPWKQYLSVLNDRASK